MRYRLRTLLILLAVLPPLLSSGYVLSAGPAAALLQSGVTGQSGEEFLHWFYGPMRKACKFDKRFGSRVDWYITLWLADRRGAPGPAVLVALMIVAALAALRLMRRPRLPATLNRP